MRSFKTYLLSSMACLAALCFTIQVSGSVENNSKGITAAELQMMLDSAKYYRDKDLNTALKWVRNVQQICVLYPNDSILGEAYSIYSTLMYYSGHVDSALLSISRSRKLYFKGSSRKKYANSLLIQGVYMRALGQPDSSLLLYEQAFKVYKEINDSSGMAAILVNKGTLLDRQGDYETASQMYVQALDIYTLLGEQKGMASCHLNLGVLKYLSEKYDEALKSFTKAEEMSETIGNVPNWLMAMENRASIYLVQNKYKKAISLFNTMLKIREEKGIQIDVGRVYTNLGNCYGNLENRSEALKYFFKALKAEENEGNENGIIYAYNGIGDQFVELGKINEGLVYLEKAMDMATKLNMPHERKMVSERLAKAFAKQGRHKIALKFYKLRGQLNDSIMNAESSARMDELETKYNSRKQARQIAGMKDLAMVNKAEKIEQEARMEYEKTRNFILSIFMFLILFLIATGMVSFFKIKKRKALIQLAHDEVIRQNEMLKYHSEQIEEKNNEIHESITYAGRIQKALLPARTIQNLGFEGFTLFRPRDIVSGDFYWMEKGKDKSVFAVADCTGHGVPGGFISMVGMILLNEIYIDKNIKMPGDILTELNRLIQISFKEKKGQRPVWDGMDISICSIDHKTGVVHYAGANNPMYIIRNEDLEIEIVKADKQPIGKSIGTSYPFISKTLKLKKGDTLYLFSDGFPDQFGGPQGKKLKYKPFQQILAKASKLGALEQQNALDLAFNEWKGEYEQIDDVCIMGITC